MKKMTRRFCEALSEEMGFGGAINGAVLKRAEERLNQVEAQRKRLTKAIAAKIYSRTLHTQLQNAADAKFERRQPISPELSAALRRPPVK